jgi:hypothetical protein
VKSAYNERERKKRVAETRTAATTHLRKMEKKDRKSDAKINKNT